MLVQIATALFVFGSGLTASTLSVVVLRQERSKQRMIARINQYGRQS